MVLAVDGAIIVAIVAVVISGVSLLGSLAALRYSHRADKRADAQERREQARERRDQERFAREGRAALEPEEIQIHDNENVAGLRQAFVRFRNIGGATAYNPSLWIADEDGNALTHRFGGRGTVDPGEPERLGADLPAPPATGELVVWLGWQDAGGQQEHDTGYRIGREEASFQ